MLELRKHKRRIPVTVPATEVWNLTPRSTELGSPSLNVPGVLPMLNRLHAVAVGLIVSETLPEALNPTRCEFALPENYSLAADPTQGLLSEMKKALITGITGQDGSYLADLLLSKGYEVHGIIRRASTFNTARIDHLYQDSHVHGIHLFLHFGDLSDSVQLVKLLYELQPDEVYNLGAQSHVRVSFDIPEYTADITGVGTIRILEAIREAGVVPRFYQASSSEMYGKVQEVPQTETTPFWPRSPYGAAKVFSYWATVNYRESYGLHASNGILFNHESPRRGETFVTRKISRAVARIKLGSDEFLYLGNLDAKRDWGYAPEYVEGMWRIMQQDEPDDYVLATNEMHTVQEFVERAFAHVELDWKQHVRYDKRYERPAEVDLLIGNPAKARKQLGWEPKVRFEELVRIMVEADLEETKQQLYGTNRRA